MLGAAIAAIAALPIIAAEKIVSGPFYVGVTQRSATMVWIVQSDERTLRASHGSIKARPSPMRIETKRFASLQPNTRYDFRVPSAGEDGKGYFKTAPAGAGPYRFAVYGDTRTRHEVHRRIIGEMIRRGIPDFVVHTGDLVADGTDFTQWPVFFDIEKELLRQTAFFPSLGNHERNTPYFQDLFQGESPYYSFDWGNAHFSVIDSNIEEVGSNSQDRNAFWTKQVRWLEEDLQKHQTSTFRFVVSHHPPFTAVSRRQGDNPHITALVPLFEKYRVSAGFFGHDHNYQHFLKNGVHYVISGGGGAPLYDVDKPPVGITQKVASIENFLSVGVSGDTAHMQAIAIDGSIIEEFDLAATLP
jgi:hypothetical protein